MLPWMCEQLLFLNPNSDLTILVCFTVVHKGEIKMSDRIKLLPHPIPAQGCRRGRLQSGRELWGQAVAGPCLPSSPALGPALAPTWGSSAVLWPSCTCREVSCHLLGLGMWECLNPGLFVHPSLRQSFVWFWLGWYFWASLQGIYLISK